MEIGSQTSTEHHHEIIEQLNDLIELDFDAVAAYQASIERLDSAAFRQQLTEFKADHDRHIRELGQVVTALGGRPKSSGDAKKVLTKGKVVLAGLAGDEAVLKAMKTNEDETNSKYEKALDRVGPVASPQIRAVLERGLDDERRHRAWLIETIDRL